MEGCAMDVPDTKANEVETRALRLSWAIRDDLLRMANAYIEGRAGDVDPYEFLGDMVLATDFLSTKQHEEFTKGITDYDLRLEVLAALYEFEHYLNDARDHMNSLYVRQDVAYQISAINLEHPTTLPPDAHWEKINHKQIMVDAVSKALASCERRLTTLAAKCAAWWRITTPETIETPVQPTQPRFRPPPCKACGSQDTKVASTKGGVRHFKCNACSATWKATRTRVV
jgi:hypothetical protein